MKASASRALSRLNKEKDDIEQNFKGVLELNIIDDNMMLWHVKFVGSKDTVYEGE